MVVVQFTTVTGAPRSGTTLLGRILGEHPSIDMVFEPSGRPRNAWLPVVDSFGGFKDLIAHEFRPVERPCLAIKQPATTSRVTSWVLETHETIAQQVPSLLVWIVRDPIETYLSFVEAQRNWWGHPDATATPEGFKDYSAAWDVKKAAIESLAEKVDSHVINYDDLVNDSERSLSLLLAKMGMDFTRDLLAFHENKGVGVRGDPNLLSSPAPVFGNSRKEEARLFAELVKSQGQST